MLQEQIFLGHMSVLQLAFAKDCLGNLFFRHKFVFRRNNFCNFFLAKFLFCKKIMGKSFEMKFFYLRYSWYGQMSQGQILPGQMSSWQLESVLDVSRNLPLKFGQNWASNSWDIANIEFLWWVVVVGKKLFQHFQKKQMLVDTVRAD